ncbi:ABC transporter permease [Candidatus Harpocratesius sp.]
MNSKILTKTSFKTKQSIISPQHIRFKRILALTQKNITLYIKKGPVIVFGLLFPFFIALSWIIGRNLSVFQVFVGILSMTSFFTATAISPVVIPIETREKSLERILSSPLRISDIILGIIIGSSIYAFLVSMFVFVVFLPFLPAGTITFIESLEVILGISLMSILGSVMGVLVSALPTDMTSNVMVLMNLIKFPLLFISGIFFSISNMTSIGRIFVHFSPITYIVDILWNITTSQNIFSIWFDLGMLLVWIIVLYFVTQKIHQITLQKRISLGGKRPARN